MLPESVIKLSNVRARADMIHKVIANDILLNEVSALVAEGKTVRLKVKGNSMLPFITGDKDSVLLVRPEVLKVNDIALACIANGSYVLHRIIKIEDDIVTLMGDGNIQGCERCHKSDIKAVAVRIFKNDGKEIDCTASWQLFQAKMWGILKPLRRYLLAVYRRCKFIKS